LAAPAFLYKLYERRLMRELGATALPRHIGVMLDGNRRWARELGQTASFGHRKGADKISEFLGWCDEVGIQVVTLWLLSTDNLKRSAEEIGQLAAIIPIYSRADYNAVPKNLANFGSFGLSTVGYENIGYMAQ